MSQSVDDSVNSNSYWDSRFGTDWESNMGREQTSFFARVAMNYLPAWIARDIRRESLGICDWGCAEGDGVDVLASGFDVPIHGVDFSESAIDKARAYYPTRSFVCDDYLSSDEGDRFDIVFSSNTLEHFLEPWAVLQKISTRARKFLILLLPFQEYERIAEHFATFDFDNIPWTVSDFSLVHARVIDTGAMEPSYWPGKQILLIFAATAVLAKLRLTLADVRFDHADHLESSAALRHSDAERMKLVDILGAAEADRARLVDQVRTVESDRARLIDSARAFDAAWQAEAARLEDAARISDLARTSAERELGTSRSREIEISGEVTKRDARINALERGLAELDLIKSSRSWRWTRPVRFLLRTIRQRGIGKTDREKMRHHLKREETAGSEVAHLSKPVSISLASRNFLLPCRNNRRDVFVWAVIDWHFRIQRPQHLARELAVAGHRVFYISNNFIDHVAPGFTVESLDESGCLFQIKLHLKGSPAIYHAVPTPDAQQQLRASIGQLLAWTRSRSCLSLVQHPYWLETARILPNQRLAYDCMDHHGGFVDNSPEVLARELDLMRTADLLVVTSDWLLEEAGKHNQQLLMVRNACQYEHFATPPERIFKDARGRRVIGYYGAIAEWFDLDLLEKVAHQFPDCLLLMIGADTAGAQQRLRHLTNVEFTGEVSYGTLPFYLAGFDVCLLPFQVIPLTLATNPVKVYEYLSAGKEVVSIALPEIRQFGELVRTGDDHASFIAAVDVALRTRPDPHAIAQRQRFAAEQTWAHRVHDLIQGIDTLPEPRVSVIVVTYNNLDLTKICLRSLELYSDYANLEVIVVDNASADDTPAYLTAWAAAGEDRHLILNPDNRGFAAANNQGLAAADGEYLVLLNNDTHVTPGWIATLVAHLRQSKTLGVIGPVTNNIGNEARIDISYDDMDGMLHAASNYTTRHAGQLTPLRTAAFFCVMLSRAVYEKVGPLDEAFGIGFFEDDDYCRRVEQAGWSIACADDVFVHHNLSASFNKLKQETRQALFEQNKLLYEKKWGAWSPHRYRGR